MRRINLNLGISLLLIFIGSAILTGGLFLLQYNRGVDSLQLIIDSQGLIFILNWLPVFFVAMTVFFLSGHLVWSMGATTFIFALPTFIHRCKVALRFAPLKPLDILLGREIFGIAKSLPRVVFYALGSGVVVFIIGMVIGLRFISNERPRFRLRCIGFFACSAVFTLLYFNVYGSAKINASLPYEGNVYNELDLYQSRGFVYSFIYGLHTSRISKPAYYDQYIKTIETAEKGFNQNVDLPESLPNIVFVMNESFSDIAMSPALNFDGHNDPMKNFKAIQKESISGYIVVPGIGGATADTEFDVLTGLNTRDFIKNVSYSFTMITRKFPGITAALKSAGYNAMAMHPGAGWFYNRQNVYPLLGFDSFLYDADFNWEDTKGGYISESQTIDRILQEYQQHLDTAGDVPLFLKCITIQNHGYYLEKYGSVRNFNTDAVLSAEDEDVLANYIEGIADCDEGLRRLVEYFRGVDQPTILVYYGDHLPAFSMPLYQALIHESDDPMDWLIKYNKTPFIIWANDAARDMIDVEAFEATLPYNHTLSAHYLGAAVLDLVDINGIDPFVDFLNKIRKQYPIVLETVYRAGFEGAPMMIFDPSEAPDLALYRCWEYFRVRPK